MYVHKLFTRTLEVLVQAIHKDDRAAALLTYSSPSLPVATALRW